MLSKFDLDRINYTTINEITDYDKNMNNTLHYPRETIMGSFFFGRKEILFEYQKLYHKKHKELQSINIIDDDQFLALQCYIEKPNLFKLWNLGLWHKALIYFQLN